MFNDAKPPHDELVYLEPADSCPANRQPADSESADGDRADRNGGECQRAYGLRPYR